MPRKEKREVTENVDRYRELRHGGPKDFLDRKKNVPTLSLQNKKNSHL